MANNKKYYGLRLPFTSKDDEKFYVDIDSNPYAEIKSDLLHLLFTPVGQRLRDPSFGTKLIEYIFEPNDDKTYTDIKIELQEIIKKYFPGITLLELTAVKSEGDVHGTDVTIKYKIDEGVYTALDSITITL